MTGTAPVAGPPGTPPSHRRRRSDRWTWRDTVVGGLIVAFVGYCLGPSLLGVRTLLSVNLLTNFYPWVALRGVQTSGHEGCTNDTIDVVMPGIARIRTDLLAGHLASWQSVVGGGSPLASVPDWGLLDPLSLPYLVLPLRYAPGVVALLCFVTSIVGTHLFLRQFGVRRAAGLLGGLVYATSGFMVMWTNWPQTRVAALIPVLFWVVERLVRRRRVVDLVPVALVVASLLFGGFPEVTGYALYLAGAYLVVRVVVVHRTRLRDGVRTLLLAGAGLVLGGAVTAVQLLPFLHFLHEQNLEYRTGQSLGGLPLSGLDTTFAPAARGLCVVGGTIYGSVNPVELVAYVGSAALVLALVGAALGRVRGPGGPQDPSAVDRRGGNRAGAPTSGSVERTGVRAFFVVATVVIVAWGWGPTHLRELTQHLPVFADNFIGRIRSVLGFTVAVLAALGFDRLTGARTTGGQASAPGDPPVDGPDGPVDHATAPRPLARWAPVAWAALVVTGAVLLGLDVLRHEHREALAGGFWPEVRHELLVPLLLIAASLVVAVLALVRPRVGRVVAAVVLPVLVIGQAAQFFHTVLPGDDPSNFYPATATTQFLAANLGHGRYTASGGTMYPATSLFYGLRTPTGHTFLEQQWEDLLETVDPHVMESPTSSGFGADLDAATVGHQPVLDRMGVTYFVAPPTDVAGAVGPLPTPSGAVTVTSPRTCPLPPGPLRGVEVETTGTVATVPGASGLTVHLLVRAGGRTLRSAAYLFGDQVPGTHLVVGVAGAGLPSTGTATATVWFTGTTGSPRLAAADGHLACAVVRPTDDGLRLVHADAGSVVYRRLDALPRIRWASRAVVVPSAARRLADLAAGVPSDTVVLDRPGPAGSGRPALLRVTEDVDGTIAARVTARGSGYLVVADALLEPGWSVTVDGGPARLVAADEAMGGVHVTAGTHLVVFRYRAPGQRTGAAVSVVAGLSLVAVVVVDRRRRRRRLRARAPGR